MPICLQTVVSPFGKVCDILWAFLHMGPTAMRKKDCGYLVLMVNGSKGNPYHFSKALVTGHGVR